MRPIFRIGFSALIAYCGTIDTFRKRKSFIAESSPIGQVDAVERDRSLHVLHAAVEPDQALAERRLPAARLSGEAHDLPVGDREGHAVERLHVALQRAVVDAEVVDGEGHVRRSLGLKTSSSPTFIT